MFETLSNDTALSSLSSNKYARSRLTKRTEMLHEHFAQFSNTCE